MPINEIWVFINFDFYIAFELKIIINKYLKYLRIYFFNKY